MIDKFRGEYEWASNMYVRPMLIGGVTYQSNEHFFASFKAVKEDERLAIINAPTPWKAKALGRKCTIRDDWPQVRVHIMAYGLYNKFFQYMDLRQKLIAAYKDDMIEGNWWHDNFWGDCMFTRNSYAQGGNETCARCQNVIGQNKLGKLLVTTGAYFELFNEANK